MGIKDPGDDQKKKLKEMILDRTLVGIFNDCGISPIVQYYIFTSVAGRNLDLFVETFNDKADVTTKAPDKFRYRATPKADKPLETEKHADLTGHDVNEADEETTKIRLAWGRAERESKRNNAIAENAMASEKTQYGLSDGDRTSMNRIWETKNDGIPLDLDYQGSDGHLGKTYKHMSRGLVYAPSSDDTLGYWEHHGRKPKRVQGADGALIETHEEQGTRPRDQQQLEDRWTYRQNTILMCSYALPNVHTMKATKTGIGKFYKHLMGKDVMKRPHNAPSIENMRHVENMAWQKVARDIAKGDAEDIDDALDKLIKDSTFWINNLYTYCDNPKGKGKGKHKGKWYQPQQQLYMHNLQPWNWQPKGGNKGGKKGGAPWNNNPKGGYKGGKKGDKGKGKGRGKGKYGALPYVPNNWYNYSDQSNATWANRRDKTEDGKPYCRKHHLWGTCPGNCGREHGKCPNKLPNGNWCNGPHAAWECPHGHNQ